MSDFISTGSIQLLVGPQSASSREQMNVRSSTRATSLGSEAQWNELGFFSGSRRGKVPAATSWLVSRVHSASEPVTQWTRSGWVSSATSLTHARSRGCVVGGDGCSGQSSTASGPVSVGVVSAPVPGSLDIAVVIRQPSLSRIAAVVPAGRQPSHRRTDVDRGTSHHLSGESDYDTVRPPCYSPRRASCESPHFLVCSASKCSRRVALRTECGRLAATLSVAGTKSVDAERRPTQDFGPWAA